MCRFQSIIFNIFRFQFGAAANTIRSTTASASTPTPSTSSSGLLRSWPCREEGRSKFSQKNGIIWLSGITWFTLKSFFIPLNGKGHLDWFTCEANKWAISSIKSSALSINLSNIENLQDRRESNPGPLCEKLRRYLCAMRSPSAYACLFRCNGGGSCGH